MAKKLIITSDDFGMTHSVNRGIVRAMTEGAVTSTNIMVPCPWAPMAAKLAAEHNLPVGIHLTLTCEWDNYRWGSVSGGKSLVDETGCLYPTYQELAASVDGQEIYTEYKEQIRILRKMGVNITHIDSHMLPPFTDNAVEKSIASIIERVAEEEGLIYTYQSRDGKLTHFDSCFGLTMNSREDFYSWLEGLEDGVHHVISHCCEDSPEQDRIASAECGAKPWALEYRKQDTEILCSPELKEKLRELDIELITVEELCK